LSPSPEIELLSDDQRLSLLENSLCEREERALAVTKVFAEPRLGSAWEAQMKVEELRARTLQVKPATPHLRETERRNLSP
jgi:hypothetical protein